MRKSFFLVTLFTFAAILFYACKKEEVGTQQFVQNYIIGKWPRKIAVNITKKNGDTIKNDTLFFGLDSPSVVLLVDTVQFAADGTGFKNGNAIQYTIDGDGENIIYIPDSLGTWNIKFLRTKSIILTQEKTEKKGPDTFIYYKEEQLIKPN